MCKIAVHVIPGASRNEIELATDGAVKVRITASAVDNKANEALVKFLSKLLKVKPITIVQGKQSRHKLVDFGEKYSKQEILRRLIPPHEAKVLP